jgi:hypothetical protein
MGIWESMALNGQGWTVALSLENGRNEKIHTQNLSKKQAQTLAKTIADNPDTKAEGWEEVLVYKGNTEIFYKVA